MKVRAVTSFAGVICGHPGQELDIPDESPVLADLLQAGYVAPLTEAKPEVPAKKPAAKAGKKKGA